MAKKKNVEKKPREMTRRQLSHHKRQQRRQRIILIGGISIIVAVVLIVLVGWIAGEYYPMHRTIIKVGDEKFNSRYFIDSLKLYGANQASSQLYTLGATVMDYIIQNEILRQEAEKVGIVVSDEEIKNEIGIMNESISDAMLDIARAQRVQSRLKDEYVSKFVPVSDNQVNIYAMMVESESLATELRQRLVAGDNFTALGAEFAQNYTSKQNKGEYGWHPASILNDLLGSIIPIDFAFGAAPGTLSQPLPDAASYKQFGYWLIKVLEINEDEEAKVQALLLSSRAEALDIKARLESGDNLSALAGEYSQYSPSKEAHGELGTIAKPADPEKSAITKTFDAYVFGPEVKIGEWSEPISEDVLWTKGGAWLVKVIDKENNRKLSTEDREKLINKAYSDWTSGVWELTSESVDRSGFTPEFSQWAAERALKEMERSQGQ